MVSSTSLRAVLGTGALLAGGLIAPLPSAHASGPVERLLQVLTLPSDPNALVVRWGAASEGLLFSRDRGKSFRALCTGGITPKLERISLGGSMYASPITVDASGKLIINTFDAVWTDDGTGCTWSKVEDPAIAGKWVSSIEADPQNPGELIAIANVSTGENDDIVANAEVLRRNAAGVWSVVGTVRKPAPQQRAYGGDLLAVKTATGTRLYLNLTAATGPLTAPQLTTIAVSNDGGKTWVESSPLPPAQEYLTLLGADPTQPDRLIGAVTSDGPDTLLISEDAGKTFRSYGTVQDVSGVTFAADGRVFVSDAGGSVEGGGVLTAAKLGQPLTKVPEPSMTESANTDCIDFDPRANKLRVCRLNRFGELDPQTGVFTELMQIESVQGLLECPGRDMKAVCEPQLNEGPSWCCTGHYPFTDFCGGWDITEAAGRRVACGLSGRAADLEAGRGPSIVKPDASVPAPMSGDASTSALPRLYRPELDESDPSGARPATATGGCALADRRDAGWTSSAVLGLLAISIARRLRRKRSAPRA